MNTDDRGFDSLTESVLAVVCDVSNTLGAGFLEEVYERALLRELCLRGIRATAQTSFDVAYKRHSAEDRFADVLAEDVLVVELNCLALKCGEPPDNERSAPFDCLPFSGRTMCISVNFQERRQPLAL
jgi:GxxExxY protein